MENNVPKLRFPEFTGEWEKKKLGEIGETYNGLTGKSKDNFGQGKPYIQYKQIFDETKIDISRFDYVEINGSEKQNKVKFGDIFFTVSSETPEEVGMSSVLLSDVDELYLNSFCFGYRPFSLELLNPFYARFLFRSELFRKEVILLAQGSTRYNLSKVGMMKITICLPSLPEQTKIANFLSAVDDKINHLKKKKDLLEKYKKGVMQKIFSQELRFKDDNGVEFAEWEEKKLGEIGETYNGLTGKSKEDFGQGKPYIQYKQIFDDTKIDISRFDYVEINGSDKQNKVEFGDILFTVSSETPEEVGMSSVLLNNVDELYLNSFCFGYRPFSLEILNPFYARFLFRSELFRKEVILLAQGSTRYNLSKVGMMKIKVNLPSLPEQTKIANFLSAIDEKINHCDRRIEKMEGWKKGLLQQMFV